MANRVKSGSIYRIVEGDLESVNILLKRKSSTKDFVSYECINERGELVDVRFVPAFFKRLLSGEVISQFGGTYKYSITEA